MAELTEKERRASIKARHTEYLTLNLKPVTVIYGLPHRSRNGVVTAAKFFVVSRGGNIENITSPMSSVLGETWNDRTGFMRCRAMSDAVELLGLRLYADPKAFIYRDMP